MNLKEFSKKTGIPVSTISKALGNYKDVNIDTKNKIVELAKKFNYVPNLYAKTLASGYTFFHQRRHFWRAKTKKNNSAGTRSRNTLVLTQKHIFGAKKNA